MTKHGAPDWAKYRPDSVTFPLQDLAELAARLGSIITFDRRGDLFWMETFEQGIAKCFTLTSGDNSTVLPDISIMETGGYSCKLLAGNAINNYATILKHLLYPGTGQPGLEIRFCIQSIFNAYIQLGIVILTGTTRLEAALRINPLTPTLDIQTGPATWTSLTPTALSAAVNLFHTVKLVINPTAETYTRLLIDHSTYDISAHTLYTINSALPPAASITVRLETLTATDRHIYLDNIIVTRDEP